MKKNLILIVWLSLLTAVKIPAQVTALQDSFLIGFLQITEEKKYLRDTNVSNSIQFGNKEQDLDFFHTVK